MRRRNRNRNRIRIRVRVRTRARTRVCRRCLTGIERGIEGEGMGEGSDKIDEVG